MHFVLLLSLLLAVGLRSYCQNPMVNTGNFYIHPGTSLAFYGNLVNNGSITDEGQTVNFMNNASIQGSSAVALKNISLSNSANITLQNSLSVTNALNLNDGKLLLNSHTLTIYNSSPTAITRNTGMIISEQTDNSSKISWTIGTTAGKYTYPFGTVGGSYIPFSVELTLGNIGNVSVATYPTAYDNIPYPSSPTVVTNVHDGQGAENSAYTVDRFWQIDKDGPTGTANITFTATSAEVSGMVDLTVQRWNSGDGTWDAPLANQVNNVANTVTVPNVSTFSPWKMTGVDPNGNSLPIELISFDATQLNNEVLLSWVTAIEINNDYFVVEKSADAVNFEAIGKVAGTGNNAIEKQYSFVDAKPFDGLNYYRLRQVDFDGTAEYSPIRTAYFQTKTINTVVAYPNPVTNGRLTITSSQGSHTARIEVLDVLGNPSLLLDFDTFDGKQDINLEGLTPGTYFIKVNMDGQEETLKVIKL